MASKIHDIDDPYQMAITTFALQRAGHDARAEAYKRLKAMSRETGDFVYWSAVEIPLNPSQIVTNRIEMGVRQKDERQGQALRATAYALMLYLDHDEFQASTPIMKWLHTQHNALLGWDSSLDSLLVLQVSAAGLRLITRLAARAPGQCHRSETHQSTHCLCSRSVSQV